MTIDAIQQSLAPDKQQTLERLQGVVERITYHSAESGYTVARLKAPRTSELVTIVGSFANLQAGQTLQMQGTWREHPKYGPQFQVTQYQETKPATLTGIEKYLGSGLIKGVGPITAKRIVAHFGVQTLDIIEHHLDRLVEVPGIAKKRIKMIQAAWVEQKAIKEVMLFLQTHGVSTTYAVKIYKHYGDESIQIVTANPYRLATDVYGIGFVTADAIARNLGIHPNSEFRYRAGLLHILSEAAEEGHCFLPQSELVERTVERLALPDHRIDASDILALTTDMAMDGELMMQGGTADFQGQFLCYAPPFFHTEQGLANRVKHLLSQPVTVDVPRVERWIDRFIASTKLQLSQQQRQAVIMAASHRVLILTGGPGTGKSFTCKTIVALWRAMGKTITLASPTGRAAQRLSEMTGQDAKTLHRLLEIDPKTMKFKRDQGNPIPAEAIVVDEASMMDLFLANSLFKAVAPNAHLLIVGDTDQLPSVGPGAVLNDLIASGLIPVVRLTQVFRQAQQSAIVTNAHRINGGDLPQLERVCNQPKSDCLWFVAESPEYGVAGIQDMVTHLIPQLGFDPARDVQVLCPMSRGEMGTRNLNQVLQQLVNPPHPSRAELVRGGMTLRVGDRILQLKNDYNREVFNGDLGIISAIDTEEQELLARFGEREVTYDYADLDEITLAFATTIHKSQGSEYPVVILPIFTQHQIMLSRNLIYTGLTRARRLVVLVGGQKAIATAISQVRDQQRYTLLAHRLKTAAAL
ncbi:ATP-dependent RecD-like DNA helicase [Leptolyngbya sp. FACHB-711]|uniref:SF1B family DNA helicase RecD2 n=1 Tax=unclassified Leptolyngbya TaxID=2650499 RepID=UPI00168396EA|nr:ATP-dependent RecD-like DNA helicase [Leptolyngbya sp. FACHB-711]MBD2024611.1 ATP-dependent RecD-like DNA helicase [Leptolyngbya sp. FACHB-711]